MDGAPAGAYSIEEQPRRIPDFPPGKPSPIPRRKPMEGLTGPLISFIGAVLIGIVVGKYISSKRK